jgi:hypothetical protein
MPLFPSPSSVHDEGALEAAPSKAFMPAWPYGKRLSIKDAYRLASQMDYRRRVGTCNAEARLVCRLVLRPRLEADEEMAPPPAGSRALCVVPDKDDRTMKGDFPRARPLEGICMVTLSVTPLASPKLLEGHSTRLSDL